MVPVKYIPKVKLENSSQLLSVRAGVNNAYLGLGVLWSFYSSVEPTLFFLGEEELFLKRKILIKVRILWDAFHIVILLIRVSREVQDISFLSFLKTT